MRICCFGDLHYKGSREWLYHIISRHIATMCNSEDIDAVAIVGDLTSTGSIDHLHQVLELLKKELTLLPVLIIPGNHDIYVLSGEEQGINSLLKLQLFNDLVEKTGFIALMKRPFVLSDIGFVGSIGWYDYSLAHKHLGLSKDEYRVKSFGLNIWADKDYVRLPFTDEEFTSILLARFEEHIKEIYQAVSKIVIVMHHLPFRKLVHHNLKLEWDYFSAFMGSEVFGQVIKKYRDKIRLVIHGHQHDGVETRVCNRVYGIKCCNCASPIPLSLEI